MYKLTINTFKRNLLFKVPIIHYSASTLPKIKVKYDENLRKEIKQTPELQQTVNQLLSKSRLKEHFNHCKHFYDISSITFEQSKDLDIYKSSILISKSMENDINTKNIFLNKAGKQPSVLSSEIPDVKHIIDDNFDIKLGTMMSYLTSEGYHFQAYNIAINEKYKKSFAATNNDIIGEVTGLHSRFVKFEPKMTMSDKDAYIVQFFKKHVKDVYHSPDFNNFFKVNGYYFVIKNSQLLLFTRETPFSKKHNKTFSKLFNGLKDNVDIVSSKDFYYLDIEASTISSVKLIESLLSSTLTEQKEKILNSVIMTTKSNDDIVNCLISYSPSREYSLKMIELLDADIKDGYAAEIKKLMEHDTKDIINKLQLIARTEPEIHHMTSILNNFKDVEFTSVLTVYLWKTLAKLKSLEPTKINYDKYSSKSKDNVWLNVPDQPSSAGVNVSVFTDASLKNETSATAQVFFVNNMLAYMHSAVNNSIASYIDSAELHAAVSAMDLCQIVNDMIKGFLKVEKNVDKVLYIDSLPALNAISLHEKKVYRNTSVKHFDSLSSAKFEDVALRYVPSSCNIADGLTKRKFNKGLYSSIWLKQIANKKTDVDKSVFESKKKSYTSTNKTVENFNKMLEKTKMEFNSLQEMEELYELHANGINKKELILSEIGDISTKCLIELRAADVNLNKIANEHGIKLETKNEDNVIKDFDVTMEALSKEVNYDNSVQMIASELSSMKVFIKDENNVPDDLKKALHSRNNILNLWEISIEEKINKISEYFDEKERLRFKDINEKYNSIKELQERQKIRYQEWKDYLKNKENQNSEEASRDMLHKLVNSNIKLMSREEKKEKMRLEAVQAQQNLEKRRIESESALRENFKSTLKAMVEYNKLNEESQRIPLKKQKEMERMFAALEKKLQKAEESRRIKQANEARKAAVIAQQSHNPEVEFENTQCLSIGYPFHEYAGITRGANLTAKQKAKLQSVVQIQQMEVAHKKQTKAKKKKMAIMARKKEIVGRINDIMLEELMKEHERDKNGMF